MAYLKNYDSSGAEVTVENPLDFGTLNRDDEEVSAWQYVTVKADNGLKTSGSSITTVIDVTGADSSDLFQLAAWTAGDTSGPAATPAAYGADLTIAASIDDTTGVRYWIRRKAGPSEAPATDTTAITRTTGVVIPE